MAADAPTVAITMGDPAGVGPEIVVKALAERFGGDPLRIVVVGDLARLRRTVDECGLELALEAAARCVARSGAMP